MTFDDIAAFVLDPRAVPDSARGMAATLLIDTLGIAAGAASLDAGRIARDHAVRFHAAASPADAATLLFDGRRASLAGASFAAATQIDNLDAHDGLNLTKGHIGCAVVPALCAFAEQMPDLTAHDALTALVMSYEVAARAAITLHATVDDYHTSGAWNALGVAALGCSLREHSAAQLRHALGIAEYHGPRSQMMREIANPTMLHDGSGMGALVGVMAVLLAEDGFEGAPAITVEAPEAAHHWADLGTVWTVEQNYIKPYPICRWAHASLDALSDLMRRHRFAADDVERINVRTFAEAAALFAGMPATTSQAQYSLPFALASLLVHRNLGPDQVQGTGLSDTRVAAQLPKITVSEDARHTARFPAGRWSDITVHLRTGQTLASGDTHAKGGPEAPMRMDEVAQKFQMMAHTLAPARRDALWAMRDRMLSTDARFADLLALIHDPVDNPSSGGIPKRLAPW
ncbi:MmgE/PrpD family protein [uncultured Tateyamaria sp.]|uniref:MmgE/PrpD family protein n=1 Tax=Tateyamaria sp. 1078 TaxID=3417464 RepID=UPI0026101D0E|nr:MmgE/PrpD family protein [uncultured Tateyamaria sp.]